MRSILPLLPLLGSTAAQAFPPAPKGATVVRSELFEGAEVSFKKTSICETTEGVNSYSGYVKIPKELLHPIASEWEDGAAAHMFFWYFEARNDPENAPTAIYLGGGPGTTSFDGMSDFPCRFNPDANSTTLNEFSWNNHVNMLYIDQPLDTGFSYVSLANGVSNLLTKKFTPLKEGDSLPELNATFRQATFNEGKPETIINNTASAARTLWAFSQVWMNDFPEQRTINDELSLWAVSYGGFYGPGTFEYFQDQNDLIKNNETGALPNATPLNLATLGLADACIDTRAMAMGYPTFAYNNTFGLQIYPEEVFEKAMAAIVEPEKGCYALIDQCRKLAEQGDPLSYGSNKTVNEACVAASKTCFFGIQAAYSEAGDRSPFDVTHSNITIFPKPYQDAFFNNRWVQEELGVPLNFTISSAKTNLAFMMQTGDPMRRSLHSLERVMESGVNVAMIYGDRDYRCNWFGGENVSLSLDFSSANEFRSAGYEPITTNCSYQGGFVREHGPLSFSRIFQAGHGVGGYQPETLSKLFDRVMFGKDVATGKVTLAEVEGGYSTKGKDQVRDVKNEVPEPVKNTCYLMQAPTSCTKEQLAALADGSALIEDYVVVKPDGVAPAPL
ncbi:unnamed protein product [Clonostachys solani]|uniref:Carboxypeptidase S1 n=1 Tax=Clonostachys solani TaxID=160281 RepID=A0A9N9Z9F5_9HYPO|nr:unnamed protein product [Clonostachys solani]